jgi:AcrR family transcriptional regulator
MLEKPARRPRKPQDATTGTSSTASTTAPADDGAESGRNADRDQGGNRQARLVTAALKLFSERAYDSVFIDDIADEAGVAHGLVSYYFGSKRNLYVAALEQVLTDLQSFTRPDPADGDVAGQIRGIIGRHFEYFRTHTQVLLGLLRASPGDTAEATIKESVHHAGMMTYLGLLDSPTDEVSPFLRSALSGCFGFTDQVIIDWLTHDQDVPIDQVVDLCTRTTIATITEALPDFDGTSG